jgi:hypothetical protein
MYEPREVTLGHKIGRLYPVLSGLKQGEKVVSSGTFLIDSESKLMAATSMMGLLGMGGIKMEQGKMGGEMGGMPMGDMKGMKGMDGMEGMKGMDGMKMDQGPTPTAREQTVDGLNLSIATAPDPPKKGENRIQLTVRAQGAPVTDAKVTLTYIMDMPGMEAETVEAKHTKDGIYEATTDFGMKGTWNIDVTVARGQGKPVKARFIVEAGK